MGIHLRLIRCIAACSLLAFAPGCWWVSKGTYNKQATTASDLRSERDSLALANDQCRAENAALRSENQALRAEKTDLVNRMREQLTQPAAIDAELQRLYDQLAVLAKGGSGIDWDAEGHVLRIADVLFDFAKADLRADGRRAIADVARTLKEQSPNIVVRIDGHTDNVPVKRADTKQRFGDLWGLSAARALTVLRELETQGISAERLYFRGFADQRPIQTNSTPDGRQANRRVEVSFVTRSELDAGTAR